MTREQAWELITQYNKEPFHLKHAVTVEGVMKYFAEALGHAEEKELWGLVGLLHDLDFEMYPEQHCRKQQEMMKEAGIDEVIIRATASHGWPHNVDVEPISEMEKVLYAIDELTGLIGACALMRPSKSVSDMELSSVKKKFKDRPRMGEGEAGVPSPSASPRRRLSLRFCFLNFIYFWLHWVFVTARAFL